MKTPSIAHLVAGAVVVLTVAVGFHVLALVTELDGLAEGAEGGEMAGTEVALRARAVLASIIVTSVGFVGIMAIVAVYVGAHVVEPLRELAERMHAIGKGAFDERLTLSSYREIAAIAAATNEMSTSLAMRERQAVHSERLASLGTLVAGIAHEINNPLTFLRGNEELMLMDAEERLKDPSISDAERTYLEDFCRSFRTNVRGFEQLSALSASLRVVSRADPHARVVVDPTQLVNGCLVLAHSRFQSNVNVAFEPMARQKYFCNPGEISQVVLNMLLNAADAVGERGAVTLETRDEGGSVALVVADTGPGIPPHVQAHLFEPFNTSKPQGTGLGLAISKQIVEKHGGSIECASSPRGTTFTIRLPAAQGPSDQPMFAATRDQIRLNP